MGRKSLLLAGVIAAGLASTMAAGSEPFRLAQALPGELICDTCFVKQQEALTGIQSTVYGRS